MSKQPQSARDPSTPLARYCIGIDLGTTNCAVAYVDTNSPSWQVELFRPPQWIALGVQDRRDSLPSFRYEFTAAEKAAATWRLPWEKSPADACVGVLARDFGMTAPGRRIMSAKSWLCHDGVDRNAELLPWHGDADVKKQSPVATSAAYLEHIRLAWDHEHPQHLLAVQDVVVTLPASFDEVARELTVEAAKRAGLPKIYLLEEPQAAFYAWIHRHRDNWPARVQPGQLILVCDIGGGTTDFTLIRARPAGDGQVQFHRAAVGRHLILGGDNLDLALAKLAEQKLGQGTLPARSWDRLLQQARLAKESLLSDLPPENYTISLPSDGSRLIGGATQVMLSAAESQATLVDGFFPLTHLDERPNHGQSGFQEFGLPYASDPAVTRHLAEFLAEHKRAGLTDGEAGDDRPEMLLFNGGTMASAQLRDRLREVLSKWFAGADINWQPEVLDHDRLDVAVAYGAAYYAMVRRGEGVKIAANLGRSYYIQVNDQPPQSLCLIPGRAQPEECFVLDVLPLRLQLGSPVQFPLWVSSTRLSDQPGQLIGVDREQLTPLPPIRSALVRGKSKAADSIDVRLEATLSEIGTLALYAVDIASGRRWQLQFDIRSTLETDRQAYSGTGEAAGTLDSQTLDACARVVTEVFSSTTSPGSLVKYLQLAVESDRRHWPPLLLRSIWQELIEHASGRRKSPDHEARWLNMVGYCLRPGYGVAVDDWRVSQTWRIVFGQLAFAAPGSRTESLILWRRIAGGLTGGQQQQLATSLLGSLRGGKLAPAAHELSEMWRLTGSLELLPVMVKLELGDNAFRQLGHLKYQRGSDAILWAIGRIGTRQPIYGPLNATIPSYDAQRWIESLTHGQDVCPDRQLSVMQLSRRTGDRYRDIDESSRKRVIEWLTDSHAPSQYVALVRDGGRLDNEEEAAVFGELLPLGIRLSK